MIPYSNPRRSRNAPTLRSKVAPAASLLPGGISDRGSIGGIGGIVALQRIADNILGYSLASQFLLYHASAAGACAARGCCTTVGRTRCRRAGPRIANGPVSVLSRRPRSVKPTAPASPPLSGAGRQAGAGQYYGPAPLPTGRLVPKLTRLPVGCRFGAVAGCQGVDVEFVVLFQFRFRYGIRGVQRRR